MFVVGIVCGLAAAVFQAVTYLLSRRYLAAGRGPLQLWVAAQLWMGLLTLPLLLLWRTPAAGWPRTLLPLGVALGGYLAAQAFFFRTVRVVPASRVAPLMGIKVLFLAGLVVALGQESLGPWQWAGVLLAVLAAVAVQRAAEPVPVAGLLGVLGTTVSFAIADVAIKDLLTVLSGADKTLAALLFALALKYVLSLVPALALLPRARISRADAAAALPYAVAWLLSMLVLFAAFNWAGVVLAVILQALRGPFAILLGAAVASRGHAHLEVAIGRASLVRQLLAAALMVVATACYVWGAS